MGMMPGYSPPSGSLNPPKGTPEQKNADSPGCMHACCGPTYGPNKRKLVITKETMHKVWMAFWKAGVSHEEAQIVVDQMQMSGIFFREEN